MPTPTRSGRKGWPNCRWWVWPRGCPTPSTARGARGLWTCRSRRTSCCEAIEPQWHREHREEKRTEDRNCLLVWLLTSGSLHPFDGADAEQVETLLDRARGQVAQQ